MGGCGGGGLWPAYQRGDSGRNIMNAIMMIAKTIWKAIGKRHTASVLVKDTPGHIS